MIFNDKKITTPPFPERQGNSFITHAIFILFVTLVLMASNSLYVLAGNYRQLFGLAILMCGALIVALCARVARISLTRWVVWVAYVFVALAIVGMGTGSFGGLTYLLVFSQIALFPLVVYSVTEARMLGNLIDMFVVITSMLASMSLLLWVLGPLTGIIRTNCSIISTWNWRGYEIITRGYYHLLFETQDIDFFGIHIVRNTSIYPEAPIYSYILCVALLMESLGLGKRHVICQCILAVSIITTFSTTGYIFLVLLICIRFLSMTERFEFHLRVLLRMITVTVAIFSIYFTLLLLNEKLGTSSGNIRLDDFRAGYLAWQNNILIGNGFAKGDIVRDYMSGFRSYNMGFSTSLMDVLARGGIIYITVFVIQFFGCFKRPNYGVIGSLFLFLWTVTIVPTIPISLFFFALGGSRFLGGSNRSFTEFEKQQLESENCHVLR